MRLSRCSELMNSISLCRSFTVNKFGVRMSSKQSYKDAIQKLNCLQSNKSTINQIKQEIKDKQHNCRNIDDMVDYLSRTGVTLNQLDKLSVIHVAGTKGKGSTSAMCESILRHHGFRTGFYSSPHLVAVRERVRINGDVVSEDVFAEHFHRVYDILYSSRAHPTDMPKYFAFLTVLAYNMFLAEKVDVAVVEVGIGGIVDFTNVLRKVPVVGITALGLDHTSILGNSLAEIARAKAGIMKPGCEAYTVQQPPDAMQVLEEVALHSNCTLTVSPLYNSYKFPRDYQAKLQAELEAYHTNASLAIQLSHAWMKIFKSQNNTNYIIKQAVNAKKDFFQLDARKIMTVEKSVEDLHLTAVSQVPYETVLGLRNCWWPGRYQVIKADYATFYLDGAHTKESMDICAKWFCDNNRYQKKVLIFSSTGDRDDKLLLKPLSTIQFESVFFVIPTAFQDTNKQSDNYSVNEHDESMSKCLGQTEIWNGLNKNKEYTQTFALGCVAQALAIIKKSNVDNDTAVLITGSLHLVGAALSILDPSLSCK